MKLVDANVLIYAVNEDSVHHSEARAWMVDALSGGDVVGLPWASLLAFIRLSTNPRVFPQPLTAIQAMDIVEGWLARPTAVAVEPTTRHAAVLRGLLQASGTAGNLTSDAHLAALAIEQGATVATCDRDLARFQVPVLVPGERTAQ